MIISRTPFRMSFFGGGTDYPVWYEDHPGATLATTINKYCYITCRRLPQFFDHKLRISYSKIELAHAIDEIEHPAVRECLRFMKIQDGIEIHHDGDLPARSGMGSSSAFTVGLLHVLHALSGRMTTKLDLALQAIHVEQTLIGENVGSQDQVCASFGGFNRIDFRANQKISVSPIIIPNERMRDLQRHLLLVFTGMVRTASEIAAAQIQNTPARERELSLLYQLVDEGVVALNGTHGLHDFGRLLHENWLIKRSLTKRISNPEIDDLYEAARSAGAVGGKLLGAGGGGFLLLFADPDDHDRIRERLPSLVHVPFQFENGGSQIIYYGVDVPETNPSRELPRVSHRT